MGARFFPRWGKKRDVSAEIYILQEGIQTMSNRKATKRALLTSVTALVMCVVMLVGTTFAWFTDTASTGVNRIQAGNLDVDIIGETSNDHVTTLKFTKANAETDAGAAEAVLWEPGCRYLTEGFRITNKGNLALKWKAEINRDDAKTEVVENSTGKTGMNLLDVIDFYVVKGTDENAPAVAIENFTGELGATATSDVYYIKGVMQTTAGNDYQNLTLDGITITVYATQLTAEFDSFDNQYDKDAKYTEVIAGGKTFTGKATLSAGITATNPSAVAVKATGADADVTILDGTFDGGAGGDNVCVWAANGAKVTIKDGTFTVGGDANGYGNSVVYSTGGDITIEGGFFYTNYSYDNKYYVLNQNNSNPGTITVKGGTFVNFNPAGGDDYLQPTDFVADGYDVIAETKANGDKWYTVVKGTGVTAGTQDALDTAISGSAVATVKLTEDGTYNLTDGIAKSKDVTFIGTKDTVIDVCQNLDGESGVNSGMNYQDGATLAFKGVTILGQASGNYGGIVRAATTFEDCTIKGKLTLYGDATFINCTFENQDDYSIWTWGAKNVTFEGCTFMTGGKAINLYGGADHPEAPTTVLAVNNCTFNDSNNGTKGKAAIEVGNDYGATYILTGNNVNVNGFAVNTEGANTGSKIWANKKSMDAAHLTVTIDGTKVQ